MEKIYDPIAVEEKLYSFWNDNGFFHSTPEKSKEPFCIVIPPPNVTGALHMGHALNNTLQDIIIRFNRLKHKNVLWVPGTDHGGIATQNVVEKLIRSEGKKRDDLGREEFIKRMWEWKESSGNTILAQLRKLGCALDWERTRFTMDDKCSRAVRSAFVSLFNKGLIYRGKKLVNWCTRCRTAISDIEVEYEERKGKLWHIKYPLKGGKKGDSAREFEDYLIVATTRPETMLGDTAVAVNPSDKRYENIVGKTVILPICGREIPIVADYIVDLTFGTGAVKVTPAHDRNDYEIAQRQALPSIEVIDPAGKMTKDAGSFSGMDVFSARKSVLDALESGNFLVETREHTHSVGFCYRCNTVIEPLLSEQWFLKVDEMSKKAIEAVKKGKIKFHPASWAEPYTLWLENLRDWCISRQIWWGHRIPVYYCAKGCPPFASEKDAIQCPACGGTNIRQDEDVLDTWFSSALWPFSVFGWPERSNELTYYYPTAVLVTGHEILYLWVARMVQMGIEFLGDVPFKEVFIHGIVRDRFGKKMSKSLGNVVDPLEIMKKFGTDALRYALTASSAPGRDMQISDELFLSARNFANKLWNASRFLMMYAEKFSIKKDLNSSPECVEISDSWIVGEYNRLIDSVARAYESYDMDSAARDIYTFFWFSYCDWYLEIAKIRINGENDEQRAKVIVLMLEMLTGVLRLLHPIMPFITEEVWGHLKMFSGYCENNPSIMNSDWPVKLPVTDDAAIRERMEIIMGIITAVRSIRSEMNIAPDKLINEVILNISQNSTRGSIGQYSHYIRSLAKVGQITLSEKAKRPPQSAVSIVKDIEVVIPLAGLIDLEKEKQRIFKEIENAAKEKERCLQKLSNESFVSRAPEKEVIQIRTRLQEAENKVSKMNESLQNLEQEK